MPSCPSMLTDPMRTPVWTCARWRTRFLSPARRVPFRTGIAIELPAGYEAQVRPRSGLALHHSITLPNAPATIDPGYRGEIKVILLNLGRGAYQVHRGDKIAQLVIARYERVEMGGGRAQLLQARRRRLRLLGAVGPRPKPLMYTLGEDRPMRTVGSTIILVLFLLMSPLAAQEDEAGCKDHPLLTRMAGFYIDSCENAEFDAHEFTVARTRRPASKARSPRSGTSSRKAPEA